MFCIRRWKGDLLSDRDEGEYMSIVYTQFKMDIRVKIWVWTWI